MVDRHSKSWIRPAWENGRTAPSQTTAISVTIARQLHSWEVTKRKPEQRNHRWQTPGEVSKSCCRSSDSTQTVLITVHTTGLSRCLHVRKKPLEKERRELVGHRSTEATTSSSQEARPPYQSLPPEKNHQNMKQSKIYVGTNGNNAAR